MVRLFIPERLAQDCARSAGGAAWLERLPAVLDELRDRWRLSIEQPFDGPDVSAAWVAPVETADRGPAVLKIGLPHMEAEHEAEGLRFWNGDPTIRLLDADDRLGAMLLERCKPGTTLRALPEAEQDIIISGLLRRMWRVPTGDHPFRPLSVMIALWTEETRNDELRWPDQGLVSEGLRHFSELTGTDRGDDRYLLATDLHVGNILSAQREPWLVIDPKPFVGDRAYDATQHLFNCKARMQSQPVETVTRFADLLEVEASRVRRWMFARAAAESRDEWDEEWLDVARALGAGL